MKKIVKVIIPIILCVVVVITILTLLSNKDTHNGESSVDTNFNAVTTISYSAGSTNSWSYGNQRKEFPRNETCYVRISSIVYAEKKKGSGTEITVEYTFTGTENCNVVLSDGLATLVDGEDPNVQVYTRTIEAENQNKAKESIVIFQYNPNESSESITVTVNYDEHLPKQFDERNTVYFTD